MADVMNQDIEDALNKIVNTTDQSGNTRKDLKNTIFEIISTLRNLFYKLKKNARRENQTEQTLGKRGHQEEQIT